MRIRNGCILITATLFMIFMMVSCENHQFDNDYEKYKELYTTMAKNIDSVSTSEIDPQKCLALFSDSTMIDNVKKLALLNKSMEKEGVSAQEKYIIHNCNLATGYFTELLFLSEKQKTLTDDEKDTASGDILQIIVVLEDLQKGTFNSD